MERCCENWVGVVESDCSLEKGGFLCDLVGYLFYFLNGWWWMREIFFYFSDFCVFWDVEEVCGKWEIELGFF